MKTKCKLIQKYGGSITKKCLAQPHLKRTEHALNLSATAESNIAIDCGCGTGSDIEYLAEQGLDVYGFDINQESVAICQQRFKSLEKVTITQSSFESYCYPKTRLIIANSSLFFAEPNQFDSTWNNIQSALVTGGVFAGDIMGVKDSWATNYRTPTSPVTARKIENMFTNFKIKQLTERDEWAPTALGKMKRWHTFSVVAVKGIYGRP